MTKLNLKPLDVAPPPTEGRYQVVLPPVLNEQFTAYVGAYVETYGDGVKPADVIAAIVSHHINNDAAFQKYRRGAQPQSTSSKRRKSGANAPPAAAPAAPNQGINGASTTPGSGDFTPNP